MSRWWMAIACVMAMRARSEACECSQRSDAEALASAEIAFDATVIGSEANTSCEFPTNLKIQPGCLQIVLIDRASCKPTFWGIEASLIGAKNGYFGEKPHTLDGDRVQYCKLPSDSIAISNYGGDKRQVSFDAKTGGAVVLLADPFGKWRTRLRVDRVIKGDVRTEEILGSDGIGGGDCGLSYAPDPGKRMRWFVKRDASGAVLTSHCDGSHEIDDKTPPMPRVEPPKPAAPPPPPAVEPAPAKKSSGCAVGDPSFAVVIALGGLVLRRRACRRARSR